MYIIYIVYRSNTEHMPELNQTRHVNQRKKH